MQDLLDLILQNITTQPDSVQIEVLEEDGRVVFNVTVAPEDMGRVIGKNGKVIQAIRSIMHVAAIRNESRVRVNVVEIEDDNSVDDSDSASNEQESAPVEPSQPEEVEEETASDSDIDLISGAIELNPEK